MSLTSAIHIGRSALTASQLGIQVAGNNIANASTPGYSRQIARLSPLRGGGNSPQLSIGAGVQVASIQRQVDSALQARLWSGTADAAGANVYLDIFSQLEATLGELNDNDLSSELSSFFSAWSERANQTKSSAAVVQQGDKLAGFIRRVRSDLSNQTIQVDQQLAASVAQANNLIGSIAQLNQAIGDAEVSGQPANTLRDQRDQLVTQLSELLPVDVIDRGREGTDVLVGSIPVVLGTQARGIELRRFTGPDGSLEVSVNTTADGSRLDVATGAVGALMNSRKGVIDATVGKLDQLATQLIWEVNKIHSTGVTAAGFRSLTGSLRFSSAQRSLALNDPANGAIAQLPFAPTNGGFVVRLKQASTGATTTVRIDVDLDGITNGGTPGTTDDTSAEGIRAALDAIGGLNAGFNADGSLRINADEGFSFAFADDTSGVLAALGVNTYFTGADAGDIAVRQELKGDPSLLASGKYVNDVLVENAAALALAGLQNQSLATLGDRSISDLWRDTVQQVGGSVAGAKAAADAAGLVRESLDNQRAGVSAVSIDEESISLLEFQRQYQGAARVISVADQLTQELLAIV
jgi:flagellar hook-associated protein 1 FlgK